MSVVGRLCRPRGVCGSGRTPADGADRRWVATRVAVKASALGAEVPSGSFCIHMSEWPCGRPGAARSPTSRPRWRHRTAPHRDRLPLGGRYAVCSASRPRPASAAWTSAKSGARSVITCRRSGGGRGARSSADFGQASTEVGTRQKLSHSEAAVFTESNTNMQVNHPRFAPETQLCQEPWTHGRLESWRASARVRPRRGLAVRGEGPAAHGRRALTDRRQEQPAKVELATPVSTA
jgi:hypothetical protein